MQETGADIAGLDATVKEYLSEQVGTAEIYDPEKSWWEV
jgi:hypothetical protein